MAALAARNHGLGPALPDESLPLVVVVATVGEQARRASVSAVRPVSYWWHLVEEIEDLGDIVAVARECPHERRATTVYEQVVLLARRPRLTGRGPFCRPPFVRVPRGDSSWVRIPPVPFVEPKTAWLSCCRAF